MIAFETLAAVEFAWPYAFLLLILPLAVYALVPRAAPPGGALRVPFYQDIVDRRVNFKRQARPWLTALMLLVWGLIVVAAARPQYLEEAGGAAVSGRDLMMAVDVSGSMKTRDMFNGDRPENRLSTVKRVAGEFIERRQGDRIGLILFGTRAYLQAPLSLDRVTINQLLQEAAIGIAGEKTAIGDAIGLAMKRLDARPGTEKLLILLTDGTNTAGVVDPAQAAELARLGGLRIHTIGVGANRSRTSGMFGSMILGRVSELDESALKQISEMTGGRYFRATDSKSLAEIYALIDELEPVDDQDDSLRPKVELFHLPLGAATIISLLLCVCLLLPADIWRISAAAVSRGSDNPLREPS